MGFEWAYILSCPVHGEFQMSDPGGVGEERKELRDLNVFLTPPPRVALMGKRQSGRGLRSSPDVNGKRPSELQIMELLKKYFWSKCTGIQTEVVATSLYGDRIIKQALGKRQPGFANECAGRQHPTLFSTKRPLAGLSQDDVDDLQWESGNIPRLVFLQFMKSQFTEGCQS
jgi:hypothetical protein